MIELRKEWIELRKDLGLDETGWMKEGLGWMQEGLGWMGE